jgi:hypothetical protein
VSTSCKGMTRRPGTPNEPVSSAPTYSVTLLSPAGGEMYTKGQAVLLSWVSNGTANVDNVRLSYTIDDGATYVTIVENTNNDGSYLWTVPGITSGTVRIKVELTDLVSALCSATSDQFGVNTPALPEPEEVPVGGGIDEEAPTVYAPSPIDGMEEPVNILFPGTYFRSPDFDTVYYLDTHGRRRPFLSAAQFFTWQDDFSNVVIVTSATLGYYPLGEPMLPRPGTVLVKFVNSPQVYTLTFNPLNVDEVSLHWIPGESAAISLFGARWSDYVIDLPDAVYHFFDLGENITDFSPRDLTLLKKRVSLR